MGAGCVAQCTVWKPAGAKEGDDKPKWYVRGPTKSGLVSSIAWTILLDLLRPQALTRGLGATVVCKKRSKQQQHQAVRVGVLARQRAPGLRRAYSEASRPITSHSLGMGGVAWHILGEGTRGLHLSHTVYNYRRYYNSVLVLGELFGLFLLGLLRREDPDGMLCNGDCQTWTDATD